MSNTPEPREDESSGVLRPFIAPPSEPLPPVEPPDLVTEPPPPVPASATPGEEEEQSSLVPVEELVADLDSLPALTDDELRTETRWTAAYTDTSDQEGARAAPADDSGAADDIDPDTEAETEAGTPTEPAVFPAASPREDAALDAAEADLAAALSDERGGRGTITVRRKPLLIGLGVLGIALVAVFALWQSGGDDGTTETSDPLGSPDGSDAVDPALSDVDTPDTPDTPDATAPGGGDQQTIDDLNQQLTDLEAELADTPVPALPGDALERVVLATDAKFVSAIETSVAVVDPFGGLALINPENNLVVATGQASPNGATRVLRTSSAVWITNYSGDELLWVDPVSNTVIAQIAIPGPDGLAKDGGTLLVASYDDGSLVRVDPGAGAITQTVDVGGSPTAVLNAGPNLGLWVAIFDTGELLQIDLASFEIIRRVTVGAGPVGLGASGDAIWVTNHEEGTAVAVDAATGEIRLTVDVGEGPTEIRGAWGYMWATVTDAHDLVQINPTTGEIITRTPLGGTGINGGPTGIALTPDALWVAVLGERSVVRIAREAIG